ncbi:hypothetical protein COL8621_00009 [Actibacterium lipolyticum]|uniref:Uncharacterized protein n=1 Tax=Actibacterium lipolyticum TaxID=1524263 RepID=A0A238JIY7_9RHOB|nr:hypothetical protein COL8621_00009 [Actibacterium lipolyticum]
MAAKVCRKGTRHRARVGRQSCLAACSTGRSNFDMCGANAQALHDRKLVQLQCAYLNQLQAAQAAQARDWASLSSNWDEFVFFGIEEFQVPGANIKPRAMQ